MYANIKNEGIPHQFDILTKSFVSKDHIREVVQVITKLMVHCSAQPAQHNRYVDEQALEKPL